jgi:hypothetical protein
MPETIFVLLDTEVYCQAGLNFEQASLIQLLEFVRSKEISLLITSVIKREVEFHLQEKANDVHQLAQRLSKDVHRWSLTGLAQQIETSLQLLTVEALQGKLIQEFKDFLNRANAEELPIRSDLLDAVMDDYFACAAPFGEGKKRKEFPDAISVLTAARWADRRNKTIYFASGDADIAKSCDRFGGLKSAEKLDEILQAITKRRADYEKIRSNVLKYVSNPSDALKIEIEDCFKDLGTDWVGRENAEILDTYDHTLQRLDEVHIIKIKADEVQVVASGYFKFGAEIEYQYPEFSTPSDYAEMRYRDQSGPIDVETKVRVDLTLALGTELDVSRCLNIVVNSGKAIEIGG